jgi:hypothetical protein
VARDSFAAFMPSVAASVAISRSLAELVALLQARGDDAAARPRIARFVMACGFTLLAEDLGVGERWFREALARRWCVDEIRAGWQATATLSRFAPPLFAGEVPELSRAELRALAGVAGHDWSAVEPSIFGSLLEQSLRVDERARLGAHFTPRAYVERLVVPTMMEPLRAQWRTVQAEVLRARAEGSQQLRDLAGRLCREFLAALAGLRVLDPACGTGNFLYVAMDLLRGLEREVRALLAELGEAMGPASVQPGQFLGIERSAWSQQIAELVLWIGYVQGGRAEDPERLPRYAGSVVIADAILAEDAGGPCASVWPDVDYIVSNPPFIGNKRMRELLGDGYAEAVRAVYGAGEDGLPGDVEYVAYWWHKAALRLRDPGSRLRRCGFITTNSVRQRQSGAVLRHHLGRGVVLQFVCPDHPWIDPGEELGSAAVRISMTVARRAEELGAGEARFVEDLDARRTPGLRRAGGALRLRETRAARINADLTIGADLCAARPLVANAGLCFQGMNLVGEGFRVSEAEARALAGSPGLRRYVQGRDLKSGGTPRQVIDLFDMDEATARASAPACFELLARRVLPQRIHNSRESYARRWWLFGEPRPGLRRALVGLSRYIATPETSAHRFFVLLEADIVPDHQIYVVASADMFVFGVLSSRVHGAWARRAGGSNGIGNDSRWNSRSTFLPFPFPDASPAQRASIGEVAGQLDRARRAVLAACPGTSLTGLYNDIEAGRRGAAGAGTGVAAVASLHAELDRAVLAAYGFPQEIEVEALLVRLLALNHERAAGEARGELVRPVWPHER